MAQMSKKTEYILLPKILWGKKAQKKVIPTLKILRGEISRAWQGIDSVEEIRLQRTKTV